MADSEKALITQLSNIETRSGRSIAELHSAVEECGLIKHGERRGWLMQRFGLGYGDANTVVALFGKPVPALDGRESAAPTGGAQPDPLDLIYVGNKAALRALHLVLMARIHTLGAFEIAPKKTYLSLRRSKQFATLGPATVLQIELGLNCRHLPDHPRLQRLPPGGMCHARTRISVAAEIDDLLLDWVQLAYDSAA